MYSPNESIQQRIKEAAIAFTGISECWIWPKSKTKAGYGQLTTSCGSKNHVQLHYAHRVSFFVYKGEIPDKMVIRHRCDNPSCFNPDHLEIGTHGDNVRDCIARGRSKRHQKKPIGDRHWTRRNPDKKDKVMCGENHFRSKLTKDNVLAILESKESCKRLAIEYNVSPTTISYIKNKKTWKSVQPIS